MSLGTLQDLLIEQVRDLYNAEIQYRALLPGMTTQATDDELRETLASIVEQVEVNLGLIAEACQLLQIEPGGVTCEAMRGLVRGTRETLSQYGDPHVIDAALIANAQRIAHYEIAGYGTARQFAQVLDQKRVAEIFADLAERAGGIDRRLTKVANGGWFNRGVNRQAEHSASI